MSLNEKFVAGKAWVYIPEPGEVVTYAPEKEYRLVTLDEYLSIPPMEAADVLPPAPSVPDVDLSKVKWS